MILEIEKNFESVLEIYGGFPLKENFLEAGNAALKKYGLNAIYEDGMILIPFINRPYYSAEELDECREEGFSDRDIARMMESRFYTSIFMEAEAPARGIRDSGYDYSADGDGAFDDDEVIGEHVSDEEFDRMVEITEAFLNAAVDCGE